MDYLDYLVPIILFLVYGFGALKKMGGQKEKVEETQEERERARKIQETIRRRIREQQSQKTESYTEEEEEWDPPLIKDFEAVPTHKATSPQPLQNEAIDYQNKIQSQTLEIEKNKEIENAYKVDNVLSEKRNYQTGNLKKKNRKRKTDLISELKNSQSLKKGFLHYEILGTPLSLRQNGSLKPSWNQ